MAQWNATLQFYRTLKAKYNTYLTVPDPYWMSGGTNKEPMGYTDAWNRIPADAAGTLEYLSMGRMYLYDGTYHKHTTLGWLGFQRCRTPACPAQRLGRRKHRADQGEALERSALG